MPLSVLARHMLAVIVLPGTVAVWVPLWIARRRGMMFTFPPDAMAMTVFVAGVIALAIGVTPPPVGARVAGDEPPVDSAVRGAAARTAVW